MHRQSPANASAAAAILILLLSASLRAATLPAGAARTDSFEEKLRLLDEAWKRKDFRLVRSLTVSLRDTAIQAEAEERPAPPASLSPSVQPLDPLPAAWRGWAAGWRFFQGFSVEETEGVDRPMEPVELSLSFGAAQADSLSRELRVARVEGSRLREVPSQVFDEIRRGTDRHCRLLILTPSRAHERQEFLVFLGNPDAELPAYPSDLVTRGEGVGLDIENDVFKAALSRQTGQLERLTLKREHGLEIFSGGEGHGEPPGIDWAHDYVDAGNFQKLRISLWDGSPDYEVVRGPLCTLVRRWGFPRSPVHPVFTPSRLLVDVEYRFYAGLPWFEKIGTMEAVKDMEASALRDDEWVFSGLSFTDPVWMASDGRLRMGEVDDKSREDLWGVGFINRRSSDAFIGLFLEHRADGLAELKHTGAPIFHYRWHGHVWSRYPLPGKRLPAGARLHQRNAYTVQPFTEASGARDVEILRRRLMHPLKVLAPGPLPRLAVQPDPSPLPQRLARAGEAGDSPVPKRSLWQALADCKDAQLYTADASVVDLGLVQDVRVRGGVVTVVMVMPHRGRPLAGYFAQGSISVHPTRSLPVKERLMMVPGVERVVVEQTWQPEWSSNQLTDEGRRKLGL